MSSGSDVLALYRVGPPWILSAPVLPFRCSMCYRRIGDITMTHGRMGLIRVSLQVGIPEGRPPAGRRATSVGRSARWETWAAAQVQGLGLRLPRSRPLADLVRAQAGRSRRAGSHGDCLDIGAAVRRSLGGRCPGSGVELAEISYGSATKMCHTRSPLFNR